MNYYEYNDVERRSPNVLVGTDGDCNKLYHGVGLNKHERKVFSQHGEDGITIEILNRIGVSNPVFVEFGIGNSTLSNTFV